MRFESIQSNWRSPLTRWLHAKSNQSVSDHSINPARQQPRNPAIQQPATSNPATSNTRQQPDDSNHTRLGKSKQGRQTAAVPSSVKLCDNMPTMSVQQQREQRQQKQHQRQRQHQQQQQHHHHHKQ